MTEKVPFDLSWYRGKRVAVTGATGLIGSYAVLALKQAGAWVRAITNDRPATPMTMMADERMGLDLMIPGDAETAVENCEIVIGCAGITGGVNLPKIDPVGYVGPATVMVINTLQACKEMKVCRFGFLSSTTVYAPAEHALVEHEAETLKPFYPLYRGIGMSKLFLERLCLYYHETIGLGVGVVRPAGAYGRFDNFDEKSSHVIPGMIRRAMASTKTFTVWGDGHDIRDFVHAEDVARGILLAVANRPEAVPYNIGSGHGITTRQLAEEVLRACGSTAELEFDESKPSALRIRRVDARAAKRDLGWEPKISLPEGLKDTVTWLRKGNQ